LTAEKIRKLIEGDLRLICISIADPATIKSLVVTLTQDLLGQRKRRFQVKPYILFIFDEAQEFIPELGGSAGIDRICSKQVETLQAPGAGLVGTYYNNVGFNDPEESLDHMLNVDPLLSVDQDWGKSRGSTWSSRWTGFIQAPYTGQVTFNALAVDGIRLEIAGTTVIDGLSEKPDRSGKINMTKGQKMPITLEFESSCGKARLKLFWQWNGQPKTVVPAEALSHDPAVMPGKYNIFDFKHRYADGYITPVDVTPYEANIWNDFRIHADCSTGKYTVAVNGREIIKDANFAQPSTMVYALSFRTGDKDIRSRGIVKFRDLPNTEEPLAKVSYRIDDVTTENLQRTQ